MAKVGIELPTRDGSVDAKVGNAAYIDDIQDGFAHLRMPLNQSSLSKREDSATFKGYLKYAHSEVLDGKTFKHNGMPVAEIHTRIVLRTEKWLAEKDKSAATKRWQNLLAAIKNGLKDPSAAGFTLKMLDAWINGDEGFEYLAKLQNGKGVQFCKADSRDALEFRNVPYAEDVNGKPSPANWQGKLEALLKAPVVKKDLTADIAKQKRVLANLNTKVKLGIVPEGFDDVEQVEAARDAVAETLRRMEGQLKAQLKRAAEKAADLAEGKEKAPSAATGATGATGKAALTEKFQERAVSASQTT